ncbi:T9SS type A sorting domain-containing protein [Flavobacterium stagni]|uniref:T9SS type A sorting domain-containing protein n=1 Tax=Flavobacterium stagni TaxID=2506421 RepID=A0A4Q1K3R5_9FLAO|nr:T9SS type A sorting domain-containing protein [Flavobacterium stagni]RXR20348.1 T9SS type A sorting domain-containing protein [Flavobacterium stagni]
MKKNLLQLWLLLVFVITGFQSAFAQPGGYAWDRFGLGNVVLSNNTPTSGILSNTTQATSTNNYYLIQWNSYADKWYNTATPYNQEFTLTWGGGGFNGPNAAFTVAPSLNKYYTIQIRGLAYASRQAVVMETDAAPQSFHANDATAVSNPGSVCSGTAATITVSLAGAKSAQERVFIRYSSAANFSGSKVVEATGTGSNWSTATAIIPGSDNTSGTIYYYAYTTTVAATNSSDHDLITLRYGNNGGSNYSYSITPNPGFVNTQFPGSATVCQGSNFDAYGQIYVAGLTEAAGQGSGIVAQIGYSSTNTNPNTWTNWTTAPYFGQAGSGNNNDEYKATFGSALAPGTYYYAFRYSINGCAFFYGGYSASGGGTWNGTSNTSGVLTVQPSFTYYQDADSDGFGNPAVSQVACSQPVGYVTNSLDCNDAQLQYVDNDGDGFGSTTLAACGVANNTDCNDNQLRYADVDGDGFGSTTLVACGGVLNNTDCNDNQLLYADVDGDGFGSTTLVACGGVLNNTDCNDNQLRYADVDGDGFGSMTFVDCGGVLNSLDCNDNQLRYTDADGDGYGTLPLVACGGSTINTDCNDAVASINPGAIDVCYDGIDNDCNGNIDNIGLPGGCTPIYTVPAVTVPNSTISYGASIITSLVANCQGYRYVVTRVNPADDTPMSAPVTVDMGLRNLFLSNLSNYAYGAKFKVETTVRINNVWQPNYAPAFFVYTPTPLSTVASCGTQISNTTTQVASSAVALVSVYRYQVQRLDASNNVVSTQVITSGLRYFSFEQVTDFRYDANYSVSCAIRNLDGVFMAYGPACTVQAPKHPTSEVRATQCNDYQVLNNNEFIYANLVRNAVQYRYRLYNIDQGYDYSVDRNANFFRLSDFPGLVPGETYSVQVAVSMPGQPDFGPFGKTCTIIAPTAARTIEDTQAAEATSFEATVYPNPFAENLYFKVNSASNEEYTIQVYDMLGKLVETKTVAADSVESTEVGANFPAGVYNVILTQGENIKTLRVIKR